MASLPHPILQNFFNLSTHKPIRFVSKTLGLPSTSPGPSSNLLTSRSPTLSSLKPSPLNLHVIHLSDEDEQDTTDQASHQESDHDQPISNARKTKSKAAPRNLPTWTKAPHLIRLDNSSDEESTTLPSRPQQAGTDHRLSRKGEKALHPRTTTEDKQNVQASKSRSPTPPPLLNEVTLLHTMEDVYQSLSLSRKDQLLAERKRMLAALQRQEEMQLKKALDELDAASTLTPTLITTPENSNATAPSTMGRGRISDPKNLGQSNDDHHASTSQHTHPSLGTTITLSISMVLDPRIAARSLKQHVDDYEHPILFTMKSAERFQVIYDEFHRRTQLPIHRLVVSHDYIKLSPFVTPESVRIYSQATLKVYESSVWEYVTSLRRQRLTQPSTNDVGPEGQGFPSRLAKVPDGNGLASSSEAPDDQPIDQSRGMTGESSIGTSSFKPTPPPNLGHDLRLAPLDSPTAPELIPITVRTKDRTSVELSVRSKTTIKSIVKSFLSEIGHKLEDRDLNRSKFKILFDGQELDLSSRVSDHEICDEDILDLIFL